VSHIPKFGDASKSPAGDIASPARDVVASPNCGICDTAAPRQNHGSYVTERCAFVGLERHTFCHSGRRPKPVRLEETSDPRLASEYIITDAISKESKLASSALRLITGEKNASHNIKSLVLQPE
jgi:hypothetical protein